MKTLLKVVVGLLLSAVTLYLFLRNLDFAKVRAGLEQANPALLIAAILIGYFGHLALRSRRWATMLAPLKSRVSFYNLFSTTAIGYALSWLAPGRIGEVVRPVLLARREAIPAAASVATIGVERIIDGATVLALAAGAAVLAPLWSSTGAPTLPRAATWLAVFALAACTAGFFAARALLREGSWFLNAIDERTKAASGMRRRLWSLLGSLSGGALFLRDGRRALTVALQSLLIWSVLGVSTWIGLLAAGVRIPFIGTFLLLAVAVMGIAVPTPGGAGSVHFAFQQGLIRMFGVEKDLAAVATVIYHPVLVYIPPVVFGLMFAWRDGLTPSRLRAAAAGPPDGPAAAGTIEQEAGASERGAGASKGAADANARKPGVSQREAHRSARRAAASEGVA